MAHRPLGNVRQPNCFNQRGGPGPGHRSHQDVSGSTIFSPSGNPPSPSKVVQSQENENVKASQEPILAGLSLLDQTLPHRPGYGTQGRAIILRTNYFSLVPDPNVTIYRYSIVITPAAVSRKRRRIIALFLQTPTIRRIGFGVATDYSTIIVTAKELDLCGNEDLEQSVLYCSELESRPHSNAVTYNVKLSPIEPVEVTELLSFLSSQPSHNVSRFRRMAETMSAMNLAVTQSMNASPTVVCGSQNTKFFSLDHLSKDLGNGPVAIQGYYSSVRGFTARILVNVNVCTSAFYPSIYDNLSGLIQDLKPNGNRSWEDLEEFLKGLRVTTDHIKDDKGAKIQRFHTIQGFARLPKTDVPSNARDTQFHCPELSSTGDITVLDYFEREYKPLEHPLLPVVNVGSRDKPIYLPSELCRIIKGQRYGKKLTAAQTKAMIATAVKPPSHNARAITDEGMKFIGMRSKNPILDAFGLDIEPKMISVHGRILAAPSLVFKNKKQKSPKSASWNMKNHQFNTTSSIRSWSILRFFLHSNNQGREQDIGIGDKQINEFSTMLRICGLNLGNPQPANRFSADLSANKDQNEEAIHAVLEKISKVPVGIILVILPNDNKHTYSRIKFCADVQFGIHTVCSVASKLKKGDLKQYFTNIGLKVNLKMGGINQSIDENQLGIVKEGMTMLVGIDVTHPSPSSLQGAPSIAGMVASIDSKLAQWPASITAQRSRSEMVIHLEAMMVERLKTWQAKNNERLPNKILVYRDGVSEGEYEAVLREEFPCLQKACEKVYPIREVKPKITLIIVGKRHHTRFFPVKSGENEADRNGNPVNGTIVDRGITMHNGWDFFLQAHTAVQGTARPAHYVVLRDEIGLEVDALEILTHNLCYLYGRATKAVSVCTPAYYAHLVCERARCYLYGSLNGDPTKSFDWNTAPWQSGVHSRLAGSMFYI